MSPAAAEATAVAGARASARARARGIAPPARRVSGPGRIAPPARRVSGPSRARNGRTGTTLARGGLALELLAALERLSSHRLLDRLIRGRAWLVLIAFALIGIVTLQLALLKLNGSVGRTLVREEALRREDASLSIENSELAAADRVQRGAAQLGMEFASSAALRALAANPRLDYRRAAETLSSSTVAAPASGEEGSSGAGSSKTSAREPGSSASSSGEEGPNGESSSQPSTREPGSADESSSPASPEGAAGRSQAAQQAGGSEGAAAAPQQAGQGAPSG